MEKKAIFTIELSVEELRALRGAVFTTSIRDTDLAEGCILSSTREMYAEEARILQSLYDRLPLPLPLDF